jgi:hypothetical protein
MVDTTWKAFAWKGAQMMPWPEGSMAVLIRWFDLQTVYILLGSCCLMSQNDWFGHSIKPTRDAAHRPQL